MATLSSVEIESYSAGTLYANAKFSDGDGDASLESIGVRSTITGASYIPEGSAYIDLLGNVSVSGVGITVKFSVSGMQRFATGEPWDIVFSLRVDGRSVKRTVRYTIPLLKTVPDSYMIPERPTQHTQCVFYNGAYKGSVGSCLSNAMAAALEISEIRNGKTIVQYSTCWAYANYQENAITACDVLTKKGAPPYQVVDAASVYGTSGYPDNLLDADAVAIYKSVGDLPEYSLPQRRKSAEYINWENDRYSYTEICDALRTSNKTVVFFIGVEKTIDDILLNDSTPVKPLAGTGDRGLHAVVLLGWKTIGGHKYWIVQNSWGTKDGGIYGDNGLFYIPWQWTGFGTSGLYGYAILTDDPGAPALPALPSSKSVPTPKCKRLASDYIIVTPSFLVDGAANYRVRWYEPVTKTTVTTDNDNINTWTFGDGYTPAQNDHAYSLKWYDSQFGRTFQVSLQYYKDGKWSTWSDSVHITALPFDPEIKAISPYGKDGVKVTPGVSSIQTGVQDLGGWDYARVFYSTSADVNTGPGTYEGYFDITYPNTVGTKTGFTKGTTYYFTLRSHNSISGWSTYRSITVPVKIGETPLWDWNDSNGSASAELTRKSHAAVTGKGPVEDFSSLVWNDLVDKVMELNTVTGTSWSVNPLSMADTRVSSSDRAITAKRFNSVNYNVSKIQQTNIADVKKGDKVLGRYFTGITEAINIKLQSL